MSPVRISVLVTLLASILFCLIIVTQPPYLRYESQYYLFNYNSTRPILEKIFDVNTNDHGWYQARELSYFVDMIDANLIRFCIEHGVVHFFSLVHYILVALISGIVTYFSVKKYNETIIPVIIIFLFITSPCILIACFFRTAKVMTAFFLLSLVLVYMRYLDLDTRSKYHKTIRTIVGIFGLILAFSDRQGFCLSIALIFSLVLFGLISVSLRSVCFRFAGIQFFGVAVNSIYNYFVGPAAILKFCHYSPSFAYQSLDYRQLQLRDFVQAVQVISNQISIFFGDVSLGWWILCLFLIFALKRAFVGVLSHSLVNAGDCAGLPFKGENLSWLSFLSLGVGWGAFVLLYGVLIMVLPVLVDENTQRNYYWIPLSVMILIYSIHSICDIIKFQKKLKPIFIGILLVLLVSNVLSVQAHIKALVKSPLSTETVANSIRLKRCILEKNLDVASFRLPEVSTRLCTLFRKTTLGVIVL